MDTKTRPDRFTHAPIFCIFCLFFLFWSSTFRFTTVRTVSPSISPILFSCHFLSPALSPHLLFSGGALLGFHAMYCWVGSLPSAQRPGILAWHWCTGQGPGLCSSGQLAEQLKVKHLGLWNQRYCIDLTCTIFAEYYVTECWEEEGWNGKRLWHMRYCVLLLLYISGRDKLSTTG